MKSFILLIPMVLLGMAGVCGCSSKTKMYDTPSKKPDGSDRNVLSASNLRKAAGKAVTEILSSDTFQSYVQRHKKASGKAPLMKIAPFKNDTYVSDLNGGMVITLITETLSKAGQVRVFDWNAA